MFSKRLLCSLVSLSIVFGAIRSASAWSPNPAKPDISVADTNSFDFLEIGSTLYLRLQVKNLTSAATDPFFIKVSGTASGTQYLPCVLSSFTNITFLVTIGPKTGIYTVQVWADYYNTIDEVDNFGNNYTSAYRDGTYHP